ncbi:hypothetical protein GLX30_04165 [Streptomyces sp. Tu 2975]|uniref:orotidine 5'-phosphate decarboxylase / HUMPS family protein n=1 Tax=Streptomyces sp. Tu 2975 TaxID=2676871 RepID=UPI0013594BEF|nr:orotidine 5'-phosphate decarboxylase / HUMPS family protein [Streptomyces sp. Tu 2975]QIP83393.1 hypothetical protein GLX30_04165 [Streptomyces sp. Tu 2975]
MPLSASGRRSADQIRVVVIEEEEPLLAVRAAGALGVFMVTVHSMGGAGIMRAAVDAARGFPGLRVLALTVVTSMTGADLADTGVDDPVQQQVLRLARLADKAGCHGVIASPQDVAVLRSVLGSGALIVTPGVALPGESPAEHARPDTPRAAVAAGASHVVVAGRSRAPRTRRPRSVPSAPTSLRSGRALRGCRPVGQPLFLTFRPGVPPTSSPAVG